MTKLSRFRALPDLASDGLWFDFEAWDLRPRATPSATTLCVRVGRMRSPRWRNRRAELIESRREDLRVATDASGARLLDEITTRCLAETILLGWANLDDDDGNPIPYSPEKAYEILQDPANDPLRQFVVEAASDREAFAHKVEADALGN